MNTKAILATLAVLGSSTAAMADTGFSFRGQASFGYRAPVVRDHRHWGYTTVATSEWNRQPEWDGDRRVNVTRPIVAVPAPTEDCANWDPTVTSQPGCDSIRAIEEPQLAGWLDLGVRDSNIGDHQFITQQSQLSQLRILAVQGAPQITRVAVTFTDGTPTAVMNVSARGCEHEGGARGDISFALPGRNVNQIVIYTTPGSRGTYAVYGR